MITFTAVGVNVVGFVHVPAPGVEKTWTSKGDDVAILTGIPAEL
jgi:hypothetical protein